MLSALVLKGSLFYYILPRSTAIFTEFTRIRLLYESSPNTFKKMLAVPAINLKVSGIILYINSLERTGVQPHSQHE
jgi:hypothetical protein